MEKQYSIAEAKSKLSAIIHSVEERPLVKLTRHGKPVAVLLSIRAYEQLSHKKKRFWKASTEFRKTVKKEDIVITDADFELLRDISIGRESEL